LEKNLPAYYKSGFSLNPYNTCVTDKTVNDHQCTVLSNVDDLKISHKNHNVITDILKILQEDYGKLQIT